MRKKANIISTIILVFLLLVGLSVMLYPIISDWWNSKVQTRAIATYNETVANMDKKDTEHLINEAHAYNEKLAKLNAQMNDYDTLDGYNDILDISGTGIMGYITIPQIKVELPIYHGTSPEVLNIAAGHLEGTSFPVGGTNTHAVISAHRGLPSAKLFSDLDKLVPGDVFTITVLDQVLTYQVEEINIVLPHEIGELSIKRGKDNVTLMTCTPYGVNTHRLLIHSRRIATEYAQEIKITSDAVQVDPMLVVPLIASPLLLVLLIFWIFGGRRERNTLTKEQIYKLTHKKDGEC